MGNDILDEFGIVLSSAIFS